MFKLIIWFNRIEQDLDYKDLERVLKVRRIVYDINDPIGYRNNWLSNVDVGYVDAGYDLYIDLILVKFKIISYY